VFLSDLQISKEIFDGEKSRGGYSLYDLVQLPNHNLGVIVSINRETFSVLDGANISYELHLQQLGARKTSSRGPTRTGPGFVESGLDKYKRNLVVGDKVDICEGPHKNITGVIKHFSRQTAFVQSTSIHRNGGIIAIDSSSLVLVGADRPSMNAPISYENRYSRRPKFTHGTLVRVQKGKYYGYVAKVLRSAGPTKFQVEFEANGRKDIFFADDLEPLDAGKRSDGYHPDRRDSDDLPRDLPPPTPFRVPPTPMRDDFSSTPSHSGSDDYWGGYNTPRNDFGTPSSDTPSASTPMSRASEYSTPDVYGNEGGQTPYTPAMSLQTPSTPGYSATTPGYPLTANTPSAQTPSSGTPSF